MQVIENEPVYLTKSQIPSFWVEFAFWNIPGECLNPVIGSIQCQQNIHNMIESQTFWTLHPAAIYNAQHILKLGKNHQYYKLYISHKNTLHSSFQICGCPDLNAVDYKICSMCQQRVNQTKVQNVNNLRQCLIDMWAKIEQNITDDATD